MISLLKHNFVAAWRNVMKYKVQNTISVLCLAVGAILFSITLYFANMLWENGVKNIFYNHPVRFIVRERIGNDYAHKMNFTNEEMKRIKSLPSVKSICYIKYVGYSMYGIYKSGNYHFLSTCFVSPDWLAENKFHSDITGKKVGILKTGTVVLARRYPDKKYYEPIIGSVVEDRRRHSSKISDVVYSNVFFGEKYQMYVVAPYDSKLPIGCSNFGYGTEIKSIKLNNGYTEEQFREEIQKVFPEYEIVLGANDNKWDIPILLLLIALGSTVLIIGMSGYLKMQLQLFLLRSREMALRRCNGAKPSQLFMLLCSEIFITFVFVAIITIAISIILGNYSIPQLKIFGYFKFAELDLPSIYCTEIWVILFSLLAAIYIAWLTVRKALKNPLSTTINSTFSQHTVWNKTIQVTQYFATMVLLFGTSVAFYAILRVLSQEKLPTDASYYKNIGIILPEDPYNICKDTKSPFIKQYGWIHRKNWEIEDSLKYSNLPLMNPTLDMDKLYCEARVTNAALYDILKVDIKECNEDSSYMNDCVYARIDEAPSIIKKLKLKYKPSNKVYTLPDSMKYIRLGWVKLFPKPEFFYGIYIIENKAYETRDKIYYDDALIIQPKNNDIDAFFNGYSKELRGRKASTVYMEWLKQNAICDYVGLLSTILAVTSLLCIIMTLYSSISLETRGKQKEVAIRKVNGAKTKDIIMLFGRYYITTLSIAFSIGGIIILLVTALIIVTGDNDVSNISNYFTLPLYISDALIIVLVTVLTLWQKIYKISHINPAQLIKKE